MLRTSIQLKNWNELLVKYVYNKTDSNKID